jgi:hypothetical protein
MHLTPDTVLVQDSEPVPATVDDEVVLLSLRAGACFGLNRIGGKIWSMLAEPCPVGRICDAMIEAHDADADTVRRDVTGFLAMLIERRLVRVVEPGAPR